MNYYGHLKLRLRLVTLLEYLLAFFIIMECRSVYSRVIDTTYYFSEGTATTAFLLLIFKSQYKLKIRRRLYYSIFSLFIYLAIFCVLDVAQNKILSFLLRMFIFFPSMVLLFVNYRAENKEYRIFQVYINVMVAFSVISLFFWIFGSCLNVVSPSETVPYRWGGLVTAKSYYGVYFERQMINIPLNLHIIYRNCGIFTEGPMYNALLCIAFLFWHSLNSKNRFQLIILILTILSTFSVLGVIVIVSYYYLLSVINRLTDLKSTVSIKDTLLFINGAVIVFICLLMFRLKYNTYSYAVRVDDILAGLRAWRSSPIWGTGYDSYSTVISYMSSFREDNVGFSSGILSILSQGGIMLLAVFCIPVFSVFMNKKNPVFIRVIYIEIIFLLFFSYFHYTYIVLLCIAYGFSRTLSWNYNPEIYSYNFNQLCQRKVSEKIMSIT